MEKELEKIARLKYSPEVSLDKLKELFDTQDADLIFIKLITGYHYSVQELKKVWDHVQVHGTYKSIVKLYLVKREEKNFGFFFSTLLQLFDISLNADQLRFLLKDITLLANKTKVPVDDAEHFLKTSIGELEPAPKPDWVNVQEGENLSLLTTVSAGGAVSEKRYQYLLDEATDIFHSFEKTLEPSPGETKISPSPDSSGEGEREDSLHSGEGVFVKEKIPLDVRETIQTYLSGISSLEIDPKDEILPNRVFGPQNRFQIRDCPYNLNEIGPCRMLNCYCRGRDDIPVDVDSGLEWFDGACDVCGRKILNKSHAIRYPFKDGGWAGVYCGWDCLKTGEFFSGTEDVDQYLRLENLRGSLELYGIMDRSAT